MKKFLPFLFTVLICGIISFNLLFTAFSNYTHKQGNPMDPGYYKQYFEMKKNEAGVIPQLDYSKWMGSMLSKTSDSTLLDSITEIGPFNVGGSTRAILVDQLDVNHLFAGGVSGGLWESNDQGLTWKTVNDFAPNLGVTAITQDPFNPQVIYYGTGESANNLDALPGQGVFKSTDGGATFTQLSSTLIDEFKFIWDVVASPTDSNTLYVSTRSSGLWKSTNAGLTFTKVFASSNGIHDIEIFPDGSIIMGVAKQGIYKSPTGQTNTFSRMSTGLPGSSYSRIELAYCQTKPANVYAMYSNYSDDGMFGFYSSNDTGRTWQIRTNPASAGLQVPFSWYCFTMGVHPTDSAYIISASTNIRFSKNGGTSWTRAQNSHSDYHAVIASTQLQDNILIGNDGGIFRYTWSDLDTAYNLNTGYNVTQFYTGAFMPYGNNVIGGTQDNGTNATFNGNPVFTKMYGADGSFTQIDQQNPNNAFLSTQNGLIYTCYNYNAVKPTFTKITNELDLNNDNIIDEGAWFINPFEINMLDGRQLYYVTKKRLWRTLDGGDSWDQVTKPINASGKIPYSIGISNSTNPVVYVGGSDAFFYRIENAATALPGSEVNLGSSVPPALNPGFMSCIKVHLYDPGTLFIGFSNYSNQGRVWKVTGATTATPAWVNISGDLPQNLPVNWVDVDPMDADSSFFAATDFGLYVTHDGGNHWMKESNIPNVPIDMLKIRRSDRKMFIYTHGRGIWSAVLMPYGNNVSARPVAKETSDIRLYPNPATNYLQIELNGIKAGGTTFVSVTDLNGKMMMQEQYEGGALPAVNISGLGNGLYIVRVINGNSSFVSRFVKTN